MKAGRVRDWLVFSDVHILVVAAGWMLGNSAIFGYDLPLPFLVLASVGAFLVYRVDRLLVDSPEDALNAPERVDFALRYRWPLLGVAAVLTLLAALLALTMQVLWLEVAFLVGALGLLYPLRILPGRRRPKDVAWLKTLLISSCWVGGGVVLPLILFDGEAMLSAGATAPLGKNMSAFGPVALTAALYRIAYILPNLIAADWLDREGDARTGSGNLVGTWSAHRAHRVLGWTASAGLVLAVVLFTLGVSPLLLTLDATGMLVLALAARQVITSHDAPEGLGDSAGVMTGLDMLVAWPLLAWIVISITG